MPTLRIATDGTITMLHNDKADFKGETKEIVRLTNILYTNEDQRWRVKPIVPVLLHYGLSEFPFHSRKSALTFEETFINELIQKGEIR